MRRSRFSEEQVIGILKEQPRVARGAGVVSQYGISDATFYKWRSKSGGLEASEGKRLRSLEVAVTKLLTFGTRREAVDWAMKEGGAPAAAGLRSVGHRSGGLPYRSTRADDGTLRRTLRELSAERRRFGYRCLHLLLFCGKAWW